MHQTALHTAVGSGGITGGLGKDAVGGAQLLLELLQGILAEFQHMVGLHLAQHAAALLPGIHISIVDAVGHKPVLASGHTAHIVARVGIAHISFIAA